MAGNSRYGIAVSLEGVLLPTLLASLMAPHHLDMKDPAARLSVRRRGENHEAVWIAAFAQQRQSEAGRQHISGGLSVGLTA
jgi:hypothetical protein